MSIVLAHASRDELDLDTAYICALKLFCLRAGAKGYVMKSAPPALYSADSVMRGTFRLSHWSLRNVLSEGSTNKKVAQGDAQDSFF